MISKSWTSKEKIIAVIQAVTANDLMAEVYSTAEVIRENMQPTKYPAKRKTGPKQKK